MGNIFDRLLEDECVLNCSYIAAIAPPGIDPDQRLLGSIVHCLAARVMCRIDNGDVPPTGVTFAMVSLRGRLETPGERRKMESVQWVARTEPGIWVGRDPSVFNTLDSFRVRFESDC